MLGARPETALRRQLPNILLGLGSAALYSTVSLAPLYLVPIQAAGAARGYKAMLAAAASSAFAIAVVQLGLLAAGGALDGAAALMSLASPLALIGALIGLAHPRWREAAFPLRALIAGAAVALVSLPAFAWAYAQPSVRSMLEAAVDQATGRLGLESVDASALLEAMRGVLAASFGAVLFAFVFGSAWAGTRLGLRWRFIRAAKAAMAEARAGEGGMPDPEAVAAKAAAATELGADEPALSPPLPLYRVPLWLVWPLLASWAGILAARLLPASALGPIAWNLALSLSLCYGVQGFAVAGALLGRIGMAPIARFLGFALVAVALLGGAIGAVVAGALVLLGTLETWLPLRTIPQGE